MQNEYCQEILNAIQVRFQFLFEQYGFVPKKVVGEGMFCLIVLWSENCQMKFYLDRGTPEYYFGVLDADSKNNKDWLDGDAICGYLFRKNPEIAIPWTKKTPSRSTEEILDMFAARLKPVADKIIAAYAANLKVDWWTDFIAEREAGMKEIRARLDSGEKISSILGGN